nr:hypothetical protein [uncultured Actinoplanes sp.]
MNRLATAIDRPAPAVRSRPLGRVAGAFARSAVYCALLIPVGTAALLAVLAGRAGVAVSWWRRLRTGLLRVAPAPAGRPGPAAVLRHAVASILLGAVALVPLGVQVLMLLRGVLYGLVDRGPYDHSWGGPGRAGAWLAHFLVGVPMSLAGLAALVGIAALHQRLTGSLDGARSSRWLAPVTVVVGLAGALFVVAWSRQL